MDNRSPAGIKAGLFEKSFHPGCNHHISHHHRFRRDPDLSRPVRGNARNRQYRPFFVVYTLSMLLARPFIDRLMDRKGVIVPGAATTALALLVLSRSTSLTGFLISALDYAAGQGGLQ